MRGDVTQVKESWQPSFLDASSWHHHMAMGLCPSPGWCRSCFCPGPGFQGSLLGQWASTLPSASLGASTHPRAGVECSWLLGITCGLWLSPRVKQAPLTCPETQKSLAATAHLRPQARQGQPEREQGHQGAHRGKWDPQHPQLGRAGVCLTPVLCLGSSGAGRGFLAGVGSSGRGEDEDRDVPPQPPAQHRAECPGTASPTRL